MDQITFITLANALRNKLMALQAIKAETSVIDATVLEWLGEQCRAGHRLPALIELYHTTMKAIVMAIQQTEELNANTRVSKPDKR